MINYRQQPLQNEQKTSRHIWIIGVCFIVWAAIVAARLVQYQVFKHDQIVSLAEKQQQRMIKTSPKRGSIFDSQGRELASSLEVESIYIAPSEVHSPQSMVRALARILSMSEDTVLARLTAKKVLVNLKRKISEEESKRIKELNFEGLHFVNETKRFYPKDDLAAYILGYVGIEEDGFAGVERQYNRHIQGSSGYVYVETDAHGRPFGRYEKQSEIGQSLYLTIDEQIQFRTEKALQQAVENVGAKGGVAIVMRPKTGEILAMTNLPGYNPNDPITNGVDLHEQRRNRAIEDSYEPGSVFKLVTYSAALEEQLLKPDTMIDCQGGSITIAGHNIKDGGHYGTVPVSKAVEVSSNVAAIKTGKLLGKDRLISAIKNFGFGKTTGVGIPGESPGFIGGTKNWSDASYGALPIGYQVGVTPLQILAAFSSVANDGVWVQPHILKQIVSTTGEVVMQPEVKLRRVVTKKTSGMMKDILQGVVVNGTAKLAKLDGYSAAGKTGTAHKFDSATGRYAANRYYASFCGFAPVNNPEIAVIVVIDEPRLGSHHGGQAAAPGFKLIAEATLQLLNVAPDEVNTDYPGTPKPDKLNDPLPLEEDMNFDDDDQVLADATVPAFTPLEAENPIVTSSATPKVNDVLKHKVTTTSSVEEPVTPKPIEDKPPKPRPVAVYTVSEGNGSIVMPQLKGEGIRSALQRCKELGLKLTFEGVGEVITQEPAAGTAIWPGDKCHVTLKKAD